MAGDFLYYTALGTIAGGRLGYCLFYDQSLFLRFVSDFPFWGVLELHRGGMASHGGMIGILLATLFFARRRNLPFLSLLDLCAISAPIGLFLGRMANFVNGELLGRPCDPNFPLAVKFPQEILAWPYSEPQRLGALSAAVENIGVSESSWTALIQKSPVSPHVDAILTRLIEAIQSGNTAVRAILEPLLIARHPSQIYQGVFEGIIPLICMSILWSKPRPHGFICAAFLMLYAVLRIVSEQFRLPDAHLGFQFLGLTRGQWLSAGLLVLSGILMIYVLRSRKVPVRT